MDPALTVEEAAARQEGVLTDALFAGVDNGFGDGGDRLLQGVRRAAVIHAWSRFRFGGHGSLSLELPDVELGRAIGGALRASFKSFGLDPAHLPEDALTDYTFMACAALNHLTEVTNVETEEEEVGEA
ncbi:MAG: hypothetical protein WEG36_05765 [Gemmatimonadota bacterium]